MKTMTDDLYKNKYRIKSARLPNWDYGSDGYYFITICTKNRELYFGDIVGGKIEFSEMGMIAKKYFLEIPNHFSFVQLDEFAIMPNHVHGILMINKNKPSASESTVPINVETGQCPVSTVPKPDADNHVCVGKSYKNTISSIIGSYKSICAREIHHFNPDFHWQSRFHDHIIRNDESLNRIRQYIIDNPFNWSQDRNNKSELYL